MSDNDKLPPEARTWLREHPDEDAASLERAWQLAGQAAVAESSFEPDSDRVRTMERHIIAETQAGVRGEVRDRPSTRSRRSRALRWGQRAAVVLFVIVAIGLWLWLRPVGTQAPIGEQVTVALPDGSTVELNSGSRLVYRRVLFGWRPFGEHTRHVRLEGEAFFSVASAEEPFVVATFNSNVTALGTRFNVRAWPDVPDPSTNVVLTEGRLRVAAKHETTRSVVTLQPGEMTQVAAGGQPTAPTTVAVQEALAWRTGGLSFIEASLGAILAEVERRTGVAIEVNPDTIRNARLSLFMERVDGAEAVLEMIAQAHGFAYHRTEEGYVLTNPARP